MFRYLERSLRRRFGKDKAFYRTIYDALGIVPDNIELYKLAFIHRSASVILPEGMPANNERLEFLGDAILEGIVSDYLFIEYPEETEGHLTQLRSRIVSRTSLDDIAKKLGLDKLITANFQGEYAHKHLSGNALEALIGAIYLDKGYNFTNRYVINKLLKKEIDLGDVCSTETDFKSRLIEWCQKSKRTIRFNTHLAPESTTQHPEFISTVVIDGLEIGHGHGSSKKEAEQNTAYMVAQVIGDEAGDHLLDAFDVTFESYRDNGSNKVN